MMYTLNIKILGQYSMNITILHLLHIQARLETFIDISTHNSHLALGIETSNEVCNWSDVTQ